LKVEKSVSLLLLFDNFRQNEAQKYGFFLKQPNYSAFISVWQKMNVLIFGHPQKNFIRLCEIYKNFMYICASLIK